MRMPLKALVSITSLVFCSTVVACAPSSHDFPAKTMDAFIQEYMGCYGLPGLAIAVVKDGDVVFTKGYGVQEVGSDRKVTPSTVFSTASVTKLFVGTAVMQLVESGAVALDDPIVDHLPYFELKDDRYRRLTVAQLLSHTSGMPDEDTEEFYASWANPEYDDDALERYVRGLGDVSLIAPPGSTSSYSNMAYEVIGDLVAKVSGTPLEEYIAEHILAPLRMNRSTLLLSEVEKDLLATPHTLTRDLEYQVGEIFPYTRRHSASGTLFSNVLDMSRFALANINRGELDGRRILQEATYDVMWKPLGTEDNTFGVSWMVEEIGPNKMYSHGGGDPGYRTEFYIVPERSMGVVVMTNCWEDEVNPIAMKALELLLGEDETDWFVYYRGVLWQTVRSEGARRAVERCRELIQEHGQSTFHPAILNQLGTRLVDVGRASDAVDLYRLNVELYPDIYQLHNSLARTYRLLGEQDLAVESYQRSLEVKPGNDEAAEFMAQIGPRH